MFRLPIFIIWLKDFIQPFDFQMRALEKYIRLALSGYWIDNALTPSPYSAEVYWLFNEIHALIMKEKHFLQVLKTLVYGKDAVWMLDDLMPFLALHYLQMPILLLKSIVHGTTWNKVNFCLGQVL